MPPLLPVRRPLGFRGASACHVQVVRGAAGHSREAGSMAFGPGSWRSVHFSETCSRPSILCMRLVMCTGTVLSAPHPAEAQQAWPVASPTDRGRHLPHRPSGGAAPTGSPWARFPARPPNHQLRPWCQRHICKMGMTAVPPQVGRIKEASCGKN